MVPPLPQDVIAVHDISKSKLYEKELMMHIKYKIFLMIILFSLALSNTVNATPIAFDIELQLEGITGTTQIHAEGNSSTANYSGPEYVYQKIPFTVLTITNGPYPDNFTFDNLGHAMLLTYNYFEDYEDHRMYFWFGRGTYSEPDYSDMIIRYGIHNADPTLVASYQDLLLNDDPETFINGVIENSNLLQLGFTYNYEIYGGTVLSIAVSSPNDPVPEPATMLLLGTGIMGIAGFRRRSRRS